jgi:hypothetical protein
MKKIKQYLFITALILSNCAWVKAATVSAVNEITAEQNDPQMMVKRLHTIKEMNLSALNASEKKSIQAEVLSIQHTLQTKDGGIYLSVGAIIIILLILILVL